MAKYITMRELDAIEGQATTEIEVHAESANASSGSFDYRVPFFIPLSQVYYWTREWQEGIKHSITDLEAGRYVDFDSDDPDAITRRFMSEED